MTVGTGLNQAEVIAAAQYLLKDAGVIWVAATEMPAFVAEVVREISSRDPLKYKTALPIVQYTKNVDISGLTDLIDILRVEYKPDQEPPEFHHWSRPQITSDLLILDIDHEPTITETTLTGTITFTQSSREVTGSGTAFTTEIARNNFICLSDASTWYRVVHVEDDETLYLELPFAETGEADEEDSTLKRDNISVCYIHWRSAYAIAAGSTNIPAMYDEILVTGTVALALHAEQTKQIPEITNADNVPATYRAVADRYMQLYQSMLNKLGSPDDEIGQGWLPREVC